MDHVILAGLIYLNGASPDAASRSAGYKQSDNGREPCAILLLSLFGFALLFAALADQFAAPVVAFGAGLRKAEHGVTAQVATATLAGAST